MCFILNKTDDYKPRVAKKDIIVYKVLRSDYSSYNYNIQIGKRTIVWQPGFHYYEKTPFKSAEIRWKLGKSNNYVVIVEGDAFHSFKKKPRGWSFWSKIVKLIIPKGALYYENDKCFVSSELIYPYKD